MKSRSQAEKEEKFQVMKAWKKKYIEMLIGELRPFGHVLEIGFGRGYAADKIQGFKPSHHTLIEPDSQKAEEARQWAKNHANVTVIESPWQKALPSLGHFEAIFFNDYPFESEIGMMNRLNPEDLKQIASQAKESLHLLEKELSQVKVHFTDEQIEEFYETVGQHHPKELPSFFKSLRDQDHITKKQYEQAEKKYGLKTQQKENEQVDPVEEEDPLYLFLTECLEHHMVKGSRLTFFCSDSISKFDDPHFFENMITNPYFDYREQHKPIEVEGFSKFYRHNEVLIPLLEKLS